CPRSQTDINECASSPCTAAGSVCFDDVNGFHCACPIGFTGDSWYRTIALARCRSVNDSECLCVSYQSVKLKSTNAFPIPVSMEEPAPTSSGRSPANASTDIQAHNGMHTTLRPVRPMLTACCVVAVKRISTNVRRVRALTAADASMQ